MSSRKRNRKGAALKLGIGWGWVLKTDRLGRYRSDRFQISMSINLGCNRC